MRRSWPAPVSPCVKARRLVVSDQLGSPMRSYGGNAVTTLQARKYGPFDPLRAHAEAGTALCLVLQSRFDEAVRHAKAAIAINNRFPVPYRALAAAEAHRGGTVAAKYALQELLRLVPDDSVSLAQKRGRWTFTPGIEPYFDGLRKAGLPE